ncbi:hypothetical protein OOK36_54355 [Streptomyces sp. NBC_00365]|nr:hypothetical protein [Streptomyces sp. NBC_00365]
MRPCVSRHSPQRPNSPRSSTSPAAARPPATPARFGELPKRILPEEMIEERAATMPNPAMNTYNADEWLVRYCL